MGERERAEAAALFQRESTERTEDTIRNLLLGHLQQLHVEVGAAIEAHKKAKSLPVSPTKQVVTEVSGWLGVTLLTSLGAQITQPPALPGSAAALVRTLGAPATALHPGGILLIAQVGSAMYGLATAASDNDYYLVHANNTRETLAELGYKPKETRDNNGPDRDVEHVCTEVRLFCESLLKGATKVVELLFNPAANYESPLWLELVQHRDAFLSEIVVRQYTGFVKEHLHRVPKHPDKEKKLLYHVFRGLHELERLAAGLGPEVWITGPDKAFIMKLRTENELSTFTRETVRPHRCLLQALYPALLGA